MHTLHPQRLRRRTLHATLYQVTDRLHDGRALRVSSDQIASTVSGWLAELGVTSPMVDDFARAVRRGDWPAAHALGDMFSVDISVAA